MSSYLIRVGDRTFVREGLPAVVVEDERGGRHIALKAIAEDPRDAAEARLLAALSDLFADLAPEVAARLARGEMPSDQELSDALSRTIQPVLADVATAEFERLGVEVGVQFDPAASAQAMAAYARQATFELIKGLNDTTKAGLQQVMAEFAATPGMNRGELEAAIRKALTEPGGAVFSPVRASMIAVTETTRTASAVMSHYQGELAAQGVEMERVWRTNNDEIVRRCPICWPKHNKPESEWASDFPNGPPAHVSCRCAVTLRAVDETKSGEVKYNPYHDRRGRFTNKPGGGGGGNPDISVYVPRAGGTGFRVDYSGEQQGPAFPEQSPAATTTPGKYALPPATVRKIQERIGYDGVKSVDDAIAVGKMVDDAVSRKLAGKQRKLNEMREVVRQRSDIETDDILKNPKWRDPDVHDWLNDDGLAELNRRLGPLREKKLALLDELGATHEQYRDALASIRQMGEHPDPSNKHTITYDGGSAAVAKSTREALQYYPRDWIGYSAIYPVNVSHDPDGRGWYLSGRIGHIRVDGRSDGRQRDVAVHEWGHRMEDMAINGRSGKTLKELERDFYDRRTKGEALTPLGAGYKPDEHSRPDKFYSAYCGKDYGGYYYEVFTMGMQGLFGPASRGSLNNDAEYRHFILGVLAGL